MSYLLLFHCNNGYAKATQYYLIISLPLLLIHLSSSAWNTRKVLQTLLGLSCIMLQKSTSRPGGPVHPCRYPFTGRFTEITYIGLTVTSNKIHVTNLIFVVPSIMLYSSEISPTRCNNCAFILRNGLLYMFRVTISPIIRSTYAVYGHR